MALSWAVVVAAELVGAQRGLGFMISDAAQLFQIPVVLVGIALIGLIGLALNLILSGVETKLVHWKGRKHHVAGGIGPTRSLTQRNMFRTRYAARRVGT